MGHSWGKFWLLFNSHRHTDTDRKTGTHTERENETHTRPHTHMPTHTHVHAHAHRARHEAHKMRSCVIHDHRLFFVCLAIKGMVERGDSVTQTLAKEFGEEALASLKLDPSEVRNINTNAEAKGLVPPPLLSPNCRKLHSHTSIAHHTRLLPSNSSLPFGSVYLTRFFFFSAGVSPRLVFAGHAAGSATADDSGAIPQWRHAV